MGIEPCSCRSRTVFGRRSQALHLVHQTFLQPTAILDHASHCPARRRFRFGRTDGCRSRGWPGWEAALRLVVVIGDGSDARRNLVTVHHGQEPRSGSPPPRSPPLPPPPPAVRRCRRRRPPSAAAFHRPPGQAVDREHGPRRPRTPRRTLLPVVAGCGHTGSPPARTAQRHHTRAIPCRSTSDPRAFSDTAPAAAPPRTEAHA